MLSKIDQYRSYLIEALDAQHAGDEEREEGFMLELDKVWLSMTASEIAQTELIAQEVSRISRPMSVRGAMEKVVVSYSMSRSPTLMSRWGSATTVFGTGKAGPITSIGCYA